MLKRVKDWVLNIDGFAVVCLSLIVFFWCAFTGFSLAMFHRDIQTVSLTYEDVGQIKQSSVTTYNIEKYDYWGSIAEAKKEWGSSILDFEQFSAQKDGYTFMCGQFTLSTNDMKTSLITDGSEVTYSDDKGSSTCVVNIVQRKDYEHFDKCYWLDFAIIVFFCLVFIKLEIGIMMCRRKVGYV